jgi:hypothetical protein
VREKVAVIEAERAVAKAKEIIRTT